MSSLLAIKYWKGKFVNVAGINPDYSYGRNNMAAFVAILKRFGIDHKVVTEQWPKVGTMDLTSHVAALKAEKPDLIFSSLLFADLPVFMKQAHAAGLTEGTKLVFPAAGWQHTLMKKEFTPEGMLFGHNTLYFANPNASPLAKEFVAWYEKTYNDYPEWEADRAYFAIDSYRAAVEKAMKAKGGSWPSQDDVIDALVGLSIESLGGKSGWRKDHIAEQTFVQGFTTHTNPYDFVTLGTFETRYATELQKPPGANFWEWIKTAEFNI
jgi:branched-chain amino acid transport system substrate-binding protein